MERNKEYRIFLSVKLLRKVGSVRAVEEPGLCVRRSPEAKLEAIDEQLLEMRREGFHAYERVLFRSSEFFSSVDLHLCTFNYGYKYYRSKLQLSSLLAHADLARTAPALRLR